MISLSTKVHPLLTTVLVPVILLSLLRCLLLYIKMGNYDELDCMKYFYFVCRIHFKSIKGKIPINHSKSSNRVPPRNIYLNPLIFYSAISALSATWCNYNWEEKDYSRSEQCGEISFRSHTIFKSKKFWTPSCIRHLSSWAIYPRRYFLLAYFCKILCVLGTYMPVRTLSFPHICRVSLSIYL